jgi:phosphatidylinositol glycan class F
MPSSSTSSTKAKSHPITLLDSDLASVFTHVHPLLVLSLYALQFKAVVADPVATLSSMLLQLSAIQVLYSVTCLPAVGTTVAPKSSAQKAMGGMKKKSDVAFGKRISVSPCMALSSKHNG